MPFTFSHPALVLPFICWRKKWLSATGLIAGSIVPDFEYFLRMRKGISNYSHTWHGLFWFDLPFALLLAIIFHSVIKKPLINHLPNPLYRRFAIWYDISWKPYFLRKGHLVLMSILLGCVLHFLWDWLLHRSADFIYYNQSTLFSFNAWMHHSIFYFVMHVVHSGLGAVALLIAVWRMNTPEAAPERKTDFRYWLLIFLLTTIFTFIRIIFGVGLGPEDVTVTIIAAFILSLTFVSALVINQK